MAISTRWAVGNPPEQGNICNKWIN